MFLDKLVIKMQLKHHKHIKHIKTHIFSRMGNSRLAP